MKPLDRAASRLAPAFWCAALAAALSAMALIASAAGEPRATAATDGHDFLVPQGIIAGGFTADASLAPGQAATGPYLKLMYPTALSANGPDLYVADTGRRLLLRIDTFSQSVTPLREIPALTGVRLKTGPDGSVYLLQPGHAAVERIARDGHRLASLASRYDILQPADVLVEPTLGRIWISDASGAVFAFHPSGRMSEPLTGRGGDIGDVTSGATLLAANQRHVVGLDPRCRCVLEFDRDGSGIGRFAENQLINPTDLALDAHSRTWILDRGDRTLKVFAAGYLVAAINFSQLGLLEITAIAIDLHRAYISDGPGGRIGVFAILPPSRSTP